MQIKSVVEDPQRVGMRRAQLVQAAIKLFSREGYHSTTVKDIATEASVSPGLIYQYVSDKHDLLFLALMHIVQRNKNEIPAALRGIEAPLLRLHVAVDAYSRVIATNKEAVMLTYRETKSLAPAYIEQMKREELETNELMAVCVRECIDAGYLATTDVELLVYRMITAAHAWPLKCWRLREIATLDQYIVQAIHAIWVAMLTPKGKRRYQVMQARRALAGDLSGPAEKTEAATVRAARSRARPARIATHS